MSSDRKTDELLRQIAGKYGLARLKDVVEDSGTKMRERDVYISLRNIVEAAESDGLEELKNAKNVYNAPVFGVNPSEGKFLIKNKPDFEKAVDEIGKYSYCFKLSPYHIINTFLTIVQAQVTGYILDDLIDKGVKHIEASIKDSLKNNPNWNEETMIKEHPVLIMPVGAAGCGKSTFYRELSDVINISCDNIRYLLFREYGPCFSSWESGLSWWVVDYLTDLYLSKGYDVFYNGVNTDLEYRSPITMEDPDPLFAGMPYDVRIVYFEPPVELSDDELQELKNVNLWEKSIDEIDTEKLSQNVQKIVDMIKTNYRRTLARTKEINEGLKQQDPFDILYSVPAPVVKLFVEQSFSRPVGENVIIVKRKEIKDPAELSDFYRNYAEKVLARQT